MFGILWGMISVVVLSATGEGFRRGNDKVLRELGKNIGIVWGGRTSMQAGGERAGRQIFLTLDDARALAAESSMIAVVSPELERGAVKAKSAYNSATTRVSGIEPQYQDIRTIELEYGRNFAAPDEKQVARVAIVGFDTAEQLFGKRNILNETITLNGTPYTVIGKIRKKNQDSNYSGPDNSKIFVPFAAMSRDMPRRDAPAGALSDIIVSPNAFVVNDLPRALDERTGRIEDVDWPLEQHVRGILARRHQFDPADKQAIAMWDTTLQTLMFGRMIDHMKQFFTIVGIVTLALGGIGVMNIMLVAVKERTREIGVRKALGATTSTIQRQFFLEGFFLTLLSGGAGMVLALGLCQLVNLAPMPERFSGMILSWPAGFLSLLTLVAIGIATSTYPARRAADLPPVEALRFEM
jgi:putative ABC transport system permease protein